jgi:AcrR family transcriptional regulator
MSAPRSARDRVRQELTREILDVARAHLAKDGPVALSLRSIARQLEMAPSALYRYYSSRDDLLSALILDAYESLADSAERASSSAFDRAPDPLEAWPAVPRAMRVWAGHHPHEWGLVFGSPVPGYDAPPATVVPYARLATALVRPVVEACRAGRLLLPPPAPPGPDQALAASLKPVADSVLPDLPAAVVARALQAWATVVGLISLEVFGHWRNTVLDPAVLFDQIVSGLAVDLGLAAPDRRPPVGRSSRSAACPDTPGGYT